MVILEGMKWGVKIKQISIEFDEHCLLEWKNFPEYILWISDSYQKGGEYLQGIKTFVFRKNTDFFDNSFPRFYSLYYLILMYKLTFIFAHI